MQKVACLFSFKLSSWVSCQKIVFNLHKAYQLDKNLELLNFNYSIDQLPHEWSATAEEIAASEPDIIVILDHKPHPLHILQQIFQLMGRKPRIIFHIFGDFTLYYPQWDKLGVLLDGFQVDFIVASERQKHLIDKFLPDNSKCTVCPFPVDKTEFFYNPALRTLQRKEWGLQNDEFAFVFTGRLSRQKRIHSLLTLFAEALTITKSKNVHLYLFGAPDHVGDPFVGKWDAECEYFRKINKIYRSLPKEIQAKIHFMGSVPNSELKAVYQGADMLVNLSVHNDEDYGMSVAEAQCSGLPAILTDWGGLAGFYHDQLPEATQYIDVVIGSRNKLIDTRAVVKALVNTINSPKFDKRKELAELSYNKVGVEASAKIVKELIANEPEKFTEFSGFFTKFLQTYLFTQNPYFNPTTRELNSHYRKIYSSYVRDNRESV